MTKLSHVENGKATMVDVSDKHQTKRVALARALVYLPDACQLVLNEQGDMDSQKGPVFQTARLAGIMATKTTAQVIPLCHPLPIENCQVDIVLKEVNCIQILTEVITTGKTGVEMEALHAASVAALTIYDMLKALSHEIVIGEVKLLEKSGGKSDIVIADLSCPSQ